MNLEDPVQFVRGVGEERAKRLARLGISTVLDLLLGIPRTHVDRSVLVRLSCLVPGAEQTVVATTGPGRASGGRGRISVFELELTDGEGRATAVWFGQPYLARALPPGLTVLVHGKVRLRPHRPLGRNAVGARGLQFQSPEYEILGPGGAEGALHGGRLVPIYRLTQGITQRQYRSVVRAALDSVLPALRDPLPAEVGRELGLPGLRDALEQAHFPEHRGVLEPARSRLAFDEFLGLQLALALARGRRSREHAPEPAPHSRPRGLAALLEASLPYRLTAGQQAVLREIRGDMLGPHPMNRLLQGDVGAGKTVVAALACLDAVERGHQCAYLAPTEILAEQQAAVLERWFAPLGVRTGILLGRTRASERREILQATGSGEVGVLVGTHALLEGAVAFSRLGLVVVDEQHRFGVMQRARIREKGGEPHCLVMSATPIPRTLALTLYGDLDVSILREMPPGRLPPRTWIVPPDRREDMLRWIGARLGAGDRAFFVYPLVEESEQLDLRDATRMAAELAGHPAFRAIEVGLVHGRMKGDAKDEALARFRNGDVRCLVATTVVEVGVDVPEATIMVVEHPERFGLSQLHQLRGRVGRGGGAAHVFLAPGDQIGETGRARLRVLVREHDGFRVAEEDLKLRGPGEVLGTAQHGLPPFRVADLLADQRWLLEANRVSRLIHDQDPGLDQPAHRDLRSWVGRLYGNRLPLFEVG